MDDIIENVGDRRRDESVTRNIEKLVDRGFKIKGWTISDSSDSRNEKEIPARRNVCARISKRFTHINNNYDGAPTN